MDFSIDLKGRVANFNLPKNAPLVPLFEAIVNSIHSIEEKQKNETFEGAIDINIIRSNQLVLLDSNDAANSNITGFSITDNGSGFNDDNMNSFLCADSRYKAKIGGKGVGRFSWLKAFDHANISSIFHKNNIYYKRTFDFSLKSSNEINDTIEELSCSTKCITTVSLINYKPEYAKNVPTQLLKIAEKIIQHCVIYFLSPQCPKINLYDNYNKEPLNLNHLFRRQFQKNTEISFNIQNEQFNLLPIKISDKNFGGNKLYLCANNRLVQSKLLDKYIVNMNHVFYKINKFWYVGILTGNYLDKNVDMNRLSFTFNTTSSGESLFGEITLDDIIRNACNYITSSLNIFLNKIETKKIESIKKYINSTAPNYKHLLKYMPNEIKNIPPGLSDEKLDDTLYSIKRKFDLDNKKEEKEIIYSLKNNQSKEEEYSTRLHNYIQKVTDSNSSCLSEYVARRKVILDLFEVGLRKKEDNKFNKEAYLHNLIYPMRQTSDDISYESHNLWLIDDSLAYCTYIASDIPFDEKKKRPDILF